jgi:tRNA A-37 threonylcarbamoyl transferase component Bud32
MAGVKNKDTDDGAKSRIWRLASDVIITPVEEFSKELLEQIDPEHNIPRGHFGIERKKVRAFPKIINKDVLDVLNAFGTAGASYEEVLDHFVRLKNLDRDELHQKMQKMVRTFIHNNFLVDGGRKSRGAALSVEPSFKPGETWLSYIIKENIHCIVDSEIYKVAHVFSGEPRALKIMQKRFPNKEMKKKMAERLRNEFELMAGINHPNIVKLWEHGIHRGRSYGILDWVEGPSVRSFAHESDIAADDRVLMDLGRQCLEALAAVHECGYLHGDVHTGNFLIKEGRVCLIDFGLARPIRIKKSEEGNYTEGGVISYMPPEYVQRTFAGEKGLWGSVAGEIYSSGVVLYSLFTKRYPYEWKFYRREYMKSILNDPPLSFVECERSAWPEVEDILARAMAKNPAERFSSVPEFIEALAAVKIPATESSIEARAGQSGSTGSGG